MVAQAGKASKSKQPQMELLRNLPAVERVLEHPEVVAWIEEVGCARQFATRAAGIFLEEMRAALLSGELDGETMKTRLDNLAAGIATAAGKLTAPRNQCYRYCGAYKPWSITVAGCSGGTRCWPWAALLEP